MRIYLAYATNLNQGLMKSRCPCAKPLGTAFLQNLRLLFKGDGEVKKLTVEECQGKEVPVGVWEISSIDEYMLDIHEDYPAKSEKVEVMIKFMNFKGEDEVVNAFYYKSKDKAATFGEPSSRYFGNCLQGYVDFDFDAIYLKDALLQSMDLMKEEEK